MTDEEVDAELSVLAVMLATPFLNGDHGELPIDVQDDIQGILWRYGYTPARELLLKSEATHEQLEGAWAAKKLLFNR